MDQKTRDDLLSLFESKLNEAMRFYLETCTRCGVCTEACHVYASMGQVRYIAAYRAEIVRRLYKKYFKGRGKFWPSVGRIDNTWGDTAKAIVNNWLGLVYQFTHLDRKQQFMPGTNPKDPLGLA